MACPWYSWQQEVKAAEASVPKVLKARTARAREIVEKTHAAMHAECAAAVHSGECPHRKADCSKCSDCAVIGKGNKGGWCNRPDYAYGCWQRPDANISPAGWCFNSLFVGDQQLTDCPVYTAWRPIWKRAFDLWRALDYRRSNPGIDIARNVGPAPDPSSYLTQDDDTGDPLSYAAMKAEERGDGLALMLAREFRD